MNSSMENQEVIVGYVLAGGRNTRMHGQIKFLLEYEGETFGAKILHALENLEEVYLSVHEEDPYRKFGCSMILDEYEAIGPMGGILSGMHALPGKPLLVMVSDNPFLEKDTVRRLCEAYREKPILTLAVAEGRIQPLLGIYPPGICPLLEELVNRKQYKMKSILSQTDYQTVPLQDAREARNINTPEEYLAI